MKGQIHARMDATVEYIPSGYIKFLVYKVQSTELVEIKHYYRQEPESIVKGITQNQGRKRVL